MILEETKICTKCNIPKTLDNYSKKVIFPLRYRTECKSCSNKQVKIKRKKNGYYKSEVYKTRKKKYRKLYPEKEKERAKRNGKNRIDKLNNCYIKNLLTQRTILVYKDIPKNLIDLKRKELTLKRKIKTHGKENY